MTSSTSDQQDRRKSAHAMAMKKLRAQGAQLADIAARIAALSEAILGSRDPGSATGGAVTAGKSMEGARAGGAAQARGTSVMTDTLGAGGAAKAGSSNGVEGLGAGKEETAAKQVQELRQERRLSGKQPRQLHVHKQHPGHGWEEAAAQQSSPQVQEPQQERRSPGKQQRRSLMGSEKLRAQKEHLMSGWRERWLARGCCKRRSSDRCCGYGRRSNDRCWRRGSRRSGHRYEQQQASGWRERCSSGGCWKRGRGSHKSRGGQHESQRGQMCEHESQHLDATGNESAAGGGEALGAGSVMELKNAEGNIVGGVMGLKNAERNFVPQCPSEIHKQGTKKRKGASYATSATWDAGGMNTRLVRVDEIGLKGTGGAKAPGWRECNGRPEPVVNVAAGVQQGGAIGIARYSTWEGGSCGGGNGGGCVVLGDMTTSKETSHIEGGVLQFIWLRVGKSSVPWEEFHGLFRFSDFNLEDKVVLKEDGIDMKQNREINSEKGTSTLVGGNGREPTVRGLWRRFNFNYV